MDFLFFMNGIVQISYPQDLKIIKLLFYEKLLEKT